MFLSSFIICFCKNYLLALSITLSITRDFIDISTINDIIKTPYKEWLRDWPYDTTPTSEVWWYTQTDEDEKNMKFRISWNPSKIFCCSCEYTL